MAKQLPTFLSKKQEKARSEYYSRHPEVKSSNSLYPDKSKSRALSKFKKK